MDNETDLSLLYVICIPIITSVKGVHLLLFYILIENNSETHPLTLYLI